MGETWFKWPNSVSRRKKDIDNPPSDKIEQVTFVMKQSLSFQMLSFCKKKSNNKCHVVAL